MSTETIIRTSEICTPGKGSQQQFFNLYKTHRYCVGVIGRQYGKSTLTLHKLHVRACRQPGKYAWLSPTIAQARKVFNEYLIKYRSFIEEYNITNKEATLKECGSLISFHGADKPDNLRGLTLHGAVMDECATMRPEVWPEIVRPMLAVHNGWCDFIGTPKGKNWFYDLFTGAESRDGWATFHARSVDSPYFSAEEYETAKRENSERVFMQEYEAQFISDSGEVFRGVRDCIKGQLEPPAQGGRYTMGVDLARTFDFTVLTVMDIKRQHVVAWERFNNLDWSYQIKKIKSLADSYKATVNVDATGLGDPIYQQLYDAGLRVNPVKFTAPIKKGLIENLAILIEKREITFPEIPELINELNLFAAEKTSTGVKYNAPSGYHDDCVISLALAADGLREPELKARPL